MASKTMNFYEWQAQEREKEKKLGESQRQQMLESLSTQKNETFVDGIITGARAVNYKKNRVFYSQVAEEDIKYYEYICDEFLVNPSDSSYRNSFIRSITEMNERLIDNNNCPIECLLYATRKLNTIFKNNGKLITDVAERLADVFSSNEVMLLLAKKTTEHIVKNWEWQSQVEILIIACGCYGEDIELLEFIIRTIQERNLEDDFRYSLTMMILQSHQPSLTDALINLTCELSQDNPVSAKIKNKIIAQDGFDSFANPKCIDDALKNGTISSSMSKNMYKAILDRFKSRGNETLSGPSPILEYQKRIKKTNPELEIVLNEVYNDIFVKNSKLLGKVTDILRNENITEFVPYIEKYLSGFDRSNSYYNLSIVYFLYANLCSNDKNRAIDFLNKQLKDFRDDKDLVAITKFLITNNSDDGKLAMRDYFTSVDPSEKQKAAIERPMKFSPSHRRLFKETFAEILEENKSPSIVLNCINNFSSTLRKENQLQQSLTMNDNLLSVLEDIFYNRFTDYSERQILSLVQIINFYPRNERTSSLLMSILENENATDRIKQETNKQIKMNDSMEEPSI